MKDTHRVAQTLTHLLVPIDELAPYAANAREHDDALLVSSLSELGQYRPIVVNRRDSTILAGNGTYAAAAELGWTHVAATYVDVDEQTARKIVLVDNRSNDLASYDDGLLAALLRQLDDDFTATGFDSSDLEALEKRLAEALDFDEEGAGDDSDELGEGFHVLVTCRDETHQAQLLERFMRDGLACKALSV